MDCEQVQRYAARGTGELSRSMQEHVRGCATCAAMLDVAVRLPAPQMPPPTRSPTPNFAELSERLALESRWFAAPRNWPTWRRRALALAFAGSIPALVLLLGARVDWPIYPLARGVAEATLLVAAMMAAIWIALRPLQRAQGWGGPLILLVGAGMTMVLASLPAAHHDHPASLAGDGVDFAARAIACAAFGTICAVPTWLALRLLARNLQLGAPAIAAASFLCGFVSVSLHCPIVHSIHLWAGHVSVLLLLATWAMWRRRTADA